MEQTAGATHQEPRRERADEDEISSQDGVRRITDTRRLVIADQEQRERRERSHTTYQDGYRQRRYEERRPPTGARRQIAYDRPNVGAMTQEWPDRSRGLNNTSYMQFPQQNRITTGDDGICNRCGMQGHIRRQCQLQVAYCTFCNATSHTTGACRARATFLRDNPYHPADAHLRTEQTPEVQRIVPVNQGYNRIRITRHSGRWSPR